MRRNSFALVSLGCTALCTLCLSGCVKTSNSSQKSSSPVITATANLPVGVVSAAYAGSLNATGGSSPYTWTITSGTLPPGLNLNATTGAITGTPTAQNVFNFAVSVSDSSNPKGSTSASLSITINLALALSPGALPPATVGTPYNQAINTVGGIPPYTFSLTGGALPAGLSLNPTAGAISGTPTGTGSSFTITVADSETPPASTSGVFNIAVNSNSACLDNSNSLLSGNYAFVANGWSSSTTASSVAGSFVADGNGNLSGGLIDIADQANTGGPQSGTFTGTYCVNSDDLATLTLTYSGLNTSGNTFVVALNSISSAISTNGSIISYDSSGLQVAGLLRQQNTSAFSTGSYNANYAFGLVGSDNNSPSNRYAAAGQFNVNGSGAFSGQADTDDGCAGSCIATGALNSGDFSIASNGRGTATLTFSSEPSVDYVFYAVSSSEMLMMAVDRETVPYILAGQAIEQTSNAFTSASLSGNSVFEQEGLVTGITPDASIGIFSASSGTYSITSDENLGGTLSSPATSGSYTVASNGRVVLTSSSAAPILYLIAPNQAFLVGTDNEVTSGLFLPQSGSGFSNASLDGNYQGGSFQPVSTATGVVAYELNADGVG